MNLVGYPLTCRLSWTLDVSSVLRASLDGMVFARRINVLTRDLLCCTGWCENAAQPRSGPQSHHPDPAGLAVVPYVQGVSDRVKRTLQHFNIRTAFKPIRTLASVFKKPKDRPSEEKIAGIVYRVECKDCDFSYIGESKRCWASRRVEHDPARAASK